jgi:hypothetical protein
MVSSGKMIVRILHKIDTCAQRSLVWFKNFFNLLVLNIKELRTMAIVNETALVYCENQFGLVDGKTASGLVRHSETYTVVGVIDSSLAGKDAGEELGEKKNGIPIFADLKDALGKLSEVPDCYIYGKAPLEAYISMKKGI